MEILGIGWQELIFIVIIALIVLGPKDMEKAGRSLGRWLNQLVQSDGWKVFQRTSTELRNLPRNLMREANMEMREVEKEIRGAIDPRLDPPDSRSSLRQAQDSASLRTSPNLPPSAERENTTQGEPPANELIDTKNDPDEHV
jgi:sec-independent protein translocase protein TatB